MDRTRTLIELVTDYSETVLLHHKTLYCLGYIDFIPNELVIQKYCHIFIREVACFNGEVLTIHNKNLSDVVFKDTSGIIPNNLKLSQPNNSEGNTFEKQIAIVTVLLDFKQPEILYFGICQSNLSYIHRNSTYILIGELPLQCYDFIRQKHNKPHTTITLSLIHI